MKKRQYIAKIFSHGRGKVSSDKFIELRVVFIPCEGIFGMRHLLRENLIEICNYSSCYPLSRIVDTRPRNMHAAMIRRCLFAVGPPLYPGTIFRS